MLTILRVFQFAFSAFWRNIWLSVATTLVMFLTLFMVTSLALLNLLSGSALEIIQEKVDLSIYFESDVTNEDIQLVRTRLQSRSDVKSLQYISKEEALETFTQRNADNPLIQTAIEELDANPLPPTLVVRAENPSVYSEIITSLTDTAYDGIVESVSLDDNSRIVERLTTTTDILRKLAIWVTVGFSVIAVLIVFNTIRLAIYTEKDEISIMRVVGATNTLIRTPLIVTGALYGVLGAIVSMIVLYPVVQYVSPQVTAFLGETTLDVYAFFLHNIVLIFLLQAGFGVLLGILSSIIAIRRYLRQ